MTLVSLSRSDLAILAVALEEWMHQIRTVVRTLPPNGATKEVERHLTRAERLLQKLQAIRG